MELKGFRAALALLAALCLPAHGADDPARAVAPADGWASQAGGTAGGAAATTAQIYSVANRAQLVNAINNGGVNPKIIKVTGTIDMTEGVPYANTGDQAIRGAVRLKSNTTLIGAAAGAGIVNGHIQLVGVSQVIIRNLKIVAPCDVGLADAAATSTDVPMTAARSAVARTSVRQAVCFLCGSLKHQGEP